MKSFAILFTCTYKYNSANSKVARKIKAIILGKYATNDANSAPVIPAIL